MMKQTMPLVQAAELQAEIKRSKIKHLQGGKRENPFVILTCSIPKCLILMFVCKSKIMGSKGTNDQPFNRNMEMATAALDPKFGVAKHRIVTSINDTDDDNQTKFQHVQQSIVSILHRVKEGHNRSVRIYFMDICIIPEMIGILRRPIQLIGGTNPKPTSGRTEISCPRPRSERGSIA